MNIETEYTNDLKPLNKFFKKRNHKIEQDRYLEITTNFSSSSPWFTVFIFILAAVKMAQGKVIFSMINFIVGIAIIILSNIENEKNKRLNLELKKITFADTGIDIERSSGTKRFYSTEEIKDIEISSAKAKSDYVTTLSLVTTDDNIIDLIKVKDENKVESETALDELKGLILQNLQLNTNNHSEEE